MEVIIICFIVFLKMTKIILIKIIIMITGKFREKINKLFF